MLLSGLQTGDFIFFLLAFLLGITLHEFGHAFVAYKLGDPTPKVQGRVTLNPVPHMDILGTIMILFAPIGWAKPVTFNPYNFRGNKRFGKILTTLAGPVMNFILAVVAAFLLATTFQYLSTGGVWESFFVRLLEAIVGLNVLLFVFNLLPIPPLDGYWILRDILPSSLARKLEPIEKYGPFILLIFVFFGLSGMVLYPAQTQIMVFLRMITGLD